MDKRVRLSSTAISLVLFPRPTCRRVCYLHRRPASFEHLLAGGGNRLHPSGALLVLHELALAVIGVRHFLTFNPSSTRRQSAIGLSANKLRGSKSLVGRVRHPMRGVQVPASVDSAAAEPGLSGRSVSLARRHERRQRPARAIVCGLVQKCTGRSLRNTRESSRAVSFGADRWTVSGQTRNRRLTDRAHNLLDLLDEVGVLA
jgi:hypothetical protein